MTQPAYTNEQSPEALTPKGHSQIAAEMLTPDQKFELLSSYMDGECSRQEQVLVEHWLDSDPHIQQKYQAQLKLQLAMKTFLQAE